MGFIFSQMVTHVSSVSKKLCVWCFVIYPPTHLVRYVAKIISRMVGSGRECSRLVPRCDTILCSYTRERQGTGMVCTCAYGGGETQSETLATLWRCATLVVLNVLQKFIEANVIIIMCIFWWYISSPPPPSLLNQQSLRPQLISTSSTANWIYQHSSPPPAHHRIHHAAFNNPFFNFPPTLLVQWNHSTSHHHPAHQLHTLLKHSSRQLRRFLKFNYTTT